MAAAITLTVAACSATPTSDPASSPTASPAESQAPDSSGIATFDEEGLVFDYPSAWREFHYEDVSSFTRLIAYLGTVDVAAPCITTEFQGGSQTECQDRFRLSPNSIVVTIQANGMPTFDILDVPAGAVPMRVGGLPAYRFIAESGSGAPTGADTTIVTTIARPDSVDNYFTIAAAIRGPDDGSLRREFDALISSLEFDPPVVRLDPTAGAGLVAAAKALAILGKDSPAWACFVPVGVHQLVIATLPNGPILAKPQLATCTSKIEPTALQLWRLTLTMELAERDPEAGLGQTAVIWVSPDGTPGSMSATAIP